MKWSTAQTGRPLEVLKPPQDVFLTYNVVLDIFAGHELINTI